MFLKIISILCFTPIIIQCQAATSDTPHNIKEDASKESLTFETTSPLNQADFDNGTAALKRVVSINGFSGKVPYNLVELDEAFKSLIIKIHADEKPDNIDLILLVDTNGKTQTAAAMRFLANLENALINHTKERFPSLKMNLACVFDSFVASGSGIIPAAIGALGGTNFEEALTHVWDMPSKMLYPKNIKSCLDCCGCLRGTAGAIVSAYFVVPEIVSEDSPDYNSLTYDAFDFSNEGCKKLVELFGSHTTHDLKSSLEIISLYDSESIVALIFGAISSRDEDSVSRVKRVVVSEAFSSAQGILEATSQVSNDHLIAEKSRKMAHDIEQFNVLFKKSLHKKYGSLSELRDSLKKRTNIARDMVILNLSADTFTGRIMVPSFSYDVKRTRNGKNIINLNYRFAIPSHLYDPKKDEAGLVCSIVDTGVNSVFPHENARITNISTATGLLIKFLDECNDKVLQSAVDAHMINNSNGDDSDDEDS